MGWPRLPAWRRGPDGSGASGGPLGAGSPVCAAPSRRSWPDEEDDLVPVGPPRRPLPGAAAALELPTEPDPLVYPTETDAVGGPFDDDEDDESGRAAAL